MNKAIEKIEVDLDGKSITLTPKQAENLKDALDDLFGVTVIKTTEKEYVPIPNAYPWTPWYWHWEREYPYTTTAGVTCSYTSDDCTLRLTG
jgi:hypothetical protein